MNEFVKKIKWNRVNILTYSAAIFLLFIIACLVANPARYIASVYHGLAIWVSTVLPSLFPFFVLTKLFLALGVVEKICIKLEPLTKFLFRSSGMASYLFLMSILSGYPVGAKLIANSVENGQITPKEANKLVGFCSTSGPMYVIGSVGVGMFVNSTVGWMMFLSHILGAVVNGIAFRNYSVETNQIKPSFNLTQDKSNLLSVGMTDSVLSILIVGGYIAIFSMIIDIFSDFRFISLLQLLFSPLTSILGLNHAVSQAFAMGLVEITRGCYALSQAGVSATVMACIGTLIISFGGISIFFQSITFLNKAKVKIGMFLVQKITHAAFACAICFLLCLCFL